MNPKERDLQNNQTAEMLSRLEEAFQQVQAELFQEIDRRIREIRQLPEDQQEDQMKELAEELRRKALEKLKEQTQSPERISEPERKANEEEKTKNFRKIIIAAQKGVEVAKNPQAQRLIERLPQQSFSDRELNNLFTHLGNYLLGEQKILFSKKGEPATEFEKAIEALESTDASAAVKFVSILAQEAVHFGMNQEEIEKKFEEIIRKVSSRPARDNLEKVQQTLREYFPSLTAEQKEFIIRFTTDPDYIIRTINEEINAITRDSAKVEALRQEINQLYQRYGERTLTETELNELLEKRIRMIVSNHLRERLIDVYIALYQRSYVETDKHFEEVEREDIMRGIEVLKNHIITSFQRLSVELKERERTETLPKLYAPTEQPYYAKEMTFDGKLRTVPRLKPVAVLKELDLSEFIQHLYIEFIHWRERTGYTHNTNYIYAIPPQEGSFYKGLGGYAERVKTGDFDSFMILPDAPLVLEAYHLYEKLHEEEHALLDWRLRPNMLLSQLSSFTNVLEDEIMNYLRIKYQGKISETRLLNAVRNAVGLARGVFLTESEKMAYADPVTTKGTGHFPSYGTIDAAPYNGLNPLHTILRWQGEALFNQIFFMPVTGEAGKFFGGWDHKKLYRTIQHYRDHFIHSKIGIEGTTQNLFIDQILGITKSGGFFQRGGWRNFYSLEGHYVYTKDGRRDLIATFKAMDAIGFEAIKFFLTSLNDTFYAYVPKPTEGEKEALFQFIYDRYFFPLNHVDYQAYKRNLREAAINELRKQKLPVNEEEIKSMMETLFVKRALTRVIALRFPTKFFRIDKDRFHKDNQSAWKRMYQLMKAEFGDMDINEFHQYMKDLMFVEMLLRSENSQKICEAIQITREREDFSLGDYIDLISFLNEEKIIELLRTTNFGEKKSPEELRRVLALYKKMREKFLKDEFLDSEAIQITERFPFTFAAEDTDMRLIAFRGTGPRTFPRSIKDIAKLEEVVVNGLISLPQTLNQIATDGKYDFTPIIEYLRKAKDAFADVHGIGDTWYEFAYKIAGLTINYFKKDTAAIALFGIFRWGKLNSVAAEYAGRSSTVYEWDSREIGGFITALETYGILPKHPYAKDVGPTYDDRYIAIFGKRIKFGKKLHIDYKWNSSRLRKEFGGDLKAIAFDMVNQFIPIMLIFLFWFYIKEAYKKITGEK